MKRVLSFQYFGLMLLVSLTNYAVGKSYYSIIVPGSLKSNRKYPIAITLHDAQEPCTIRVSIEGPSFNESKNVYCQPFELKLLEFMPQKLAEGEYKLKAEGISGLSFKNETILFVDANYGPHIYIQTDRAIYKPGDLVQFRIVILDEHTRPLKIKEPIRIEILDHLDNRVKQLKDITLIKGVYTGQFKLSDYPVLGEWKIKVILSGKYAYTDFKTITVQKYLLPKFSVNLKAPAYLIRGDSSLKVIIFGKYTYDKYVAGQAVIELWDPMKDKLLQMKEIELETVAFVEFHLGKEYENLEIYKIEVRLTEALTGISQSEHRFIDVKNQRYNIRIPYEDIEFRDDKPYRLKAYIEHWSGGSVLNDKTPVIMKHGDKEYESYIDSFGVATFEFLQQSESDHEFVFKDSRQKFPNIQQSEHVLLNRREYCRLELIGGRPRLGHAIEIEVSSIENIPYFVYTIMGHGTMIHMELVKVPANQKSYIIRLTPSIEWIPIAFVYVHYIQDGEFRYEELKLKFPSEFENQISVKAPKEVGPGKEVTIDIKAEPNSYVSILAVDLSVYLLDSSYDLKKHNILHDLSYDLSYIPTSSSQYPGIISGLITLTNGHYPYAVVQPEKTYRPARNIPPKFRSNFPETWIFENFEIKDGNTQLSLNIPDTITTWRLTAFSNNDIKGFGIVDGPTDITTIQPFFISLNLPYSVKRGEIVAVSVIIFNYLNQTLEAEVVMYNDKEEFYFMQSNLQEVEKSDDNQKQIKRINVPLETGKTVTFYINPRQVGDISIKISASSPLYSDALVQKLKVEPEGIPKHHNKVMYLNIIPNETFSSVFFLIFPDEMIPDSEYITLSLGGDYMVPTVETLEKFEDLVQLPTGCGEQNMINFAPNILILHYLKINGKLAKEKDLVRKIRSFIDIGYQQQLSFRHRTGGYSVFGESSDSEASNWLTAYVVRFLLKSAKYSVVEPRIIAEDLEYLSKQQKSNGEFSQRGYQFSSTHQNRYGFTAFVLLAFLEDRKYALKYQTIIQKALQYINSNIDNIHDIYALSIVAYALKMARDNKANVAIEKLKQQSKTHNGLMWWSGDNRNTANDVEITAYALMALLDTPGDHTPILQWLIQQRNSQGGFKSTQDTVVGLEALVKYSESYKSLQNINLIVKYRAKDREGIEVAYDDFKVDNDNVLILQQHELPKNTRHISFEVKGNGHSLIQVSYQYYIIETDQYRHFLIQPKTTKHNAKEFDLEVCFTYQAPTDLSNSKTNMVIMEINLPSGCRSDVESYYDIEDNELLQRIETKNSHSTIVLYMENLLAGVKNCLNFQVDIVNDIIKPKPAAIIIYDYYNLSRYSTEFYNI